MSDPQQQPENLFAPPKAESAELTEQHSQVEYAGFFIRLLAYLVDLVLIILFALISFSMLPSDGSANQSIGVVALLFVYVAIPIATVLFWRLKGGTPGKLMVGIKVVRSDTLEKAGLGRLVVRYIVYSLSFIFLICFIWIFIDAKNRGVHDLASDTVVIKV